MKIIEVLQERFGFTRNEILVIVFLAAALLAGAGIRRLGPSPAPRAAPHFDYSSSDSEYAARIGTLAMPAPSGRPPAGHSPKARPAPGSVDINHADSAALTGLPGIGPAYARRILAYRAAHGRFASVEVLGHVKGIGRAKLEKMKPYVVIR